MVKFAIKNLLRHKRRTFLTFSILSVAILYYIVISGLLDGFEIESTKNFIELETAHIKIKDKNFNEETFEGRIKNPNLIIEKIKNFMFIKSFTKRLKIYGFLDNGIDNYPVVIIGVKWSEDTIVYKINKYLKLNFQNGILLGEVIAEKFGVKEGDYVFLNFRTKEGTFVSKEVEIKGILSTPSYFLNNLYVIMDIDSLNILGEFEGEITEISIIVDDYEKTFEYKNIISEYLKDLRITTWQEEGKDYLEISNTKKLFQAIFILFIILLGIIGTTNTLNISIFERIKEIGTLKSLGMKDSEIRKLLVIEGVMIGLLGTLLGVIFGVLINFYFVKYGIDWTPLLPKDINLAYRVSGVVKSAWNTSSIMISFIIGPFSTFIASYIPAQRASKLTPAECLRWI
ncbi:MAG: FtsX-like permease family protein [Candidatus Hydrothermales bacterium]